ncbi:DNA polymerase III subunit beta [Rhizobium rhizogenes]|uniref:DNA polymerase III subunit beta n=1 Tax=Rhizobium rhizogenes TaxID=359 RepID=UPI0022BFAAB1|nr:DNA polymerase III subunit beta [Rhizobium rhizogenes]MCZ7466432.1 DNA polymerase III subunit beta [Rhizobium rhizogenes]
MRIETCAGQLKAALRLCEPFVEKRACIPMLTMVKFEGGKIVATDLDKQIEVVLPSVSFKGAGLVVFWPLRRLVAELQDDVVITITRSENAVEVVAETGRYFLPTADLADFPAIKLPLIRRKLEIDGEKLRAALIFALPAVSTDETRYYLNGVCLSGHDVVATNGHALAVHYKALDEVVNNAIIPRSLAAVIAKLPPFASVSLYHHGDPNFPGCIGFDGSGITITAKLIDGTYPDWRRVVPADDLIEAHLARADMLKLLRRMSVVVGRQSYGLALASDGSKLAVSVRDATADFAAQDFIPADGSEFAAMFNGRNLRDAIASIGGDAISIFSKGTFHPIILRSDASNDRAFVVMPMRDVVGEIETSRALLQKLRQDVAA